MSDPMMTPSEARGAREGPHRQPFEELFGPADRRPRGKGTTAVTPPRWELLAAVIACLVALFSLASVITGDDYPHCPDGLATAYTQTRIPYVDDSGNARERLATHATCTPEEHQ